MASYRNNKATKLLFPPFTQDVRSPFELLDQQMPGSFGDLQDLHVTCIIKLLLHWNIFQTASSRTTCFLSETLFVGAAGEVSFDDLTAGVVSSTDPTSILLLV